MKNVKKWQFGGALLSIAVAIGVLFSSCGDPQEAAVSQLYESNYAFTVEDFLRAAASGDLEAVRWFIGAGMDASAADISKTSALHLAAAEKQSKVVEELILRGADPSTVRLDGRTPVMMAAESGDGRSVEMLLNAGGAAIGKDNQGWSAIGLASFRGYGRAVDALAPYSRPHLDDALMLAAMSGHVEAIAPLVGSDAKVDARSAAGRTPLMLAAARGHQDAVKFLLHHGANHYATDIDAHTATQLAAENGHSDVARLIEAAPESGNAPGAGDSSFVPNRNGSPVHYSSLTRRIDGQTLVAAESGVRDLRELLTMTSYREKQLPIEFDGVIPAGGEGAEIRTLFGDHATYLVKKGEIIPGTELELVAVEIHWSRGKEGQGEPVSAARLVVRDLQSDEVIGVTKNDPGKSAKSFALALYHGTEQVYELRRGDRFKVIGKEFRVMDVRSHKIVFEEFGRGLVTTLERSH